MEPLMQIQQRKKKSITDIGYTVRMDRNLLVKVREKAKEKDMSVNLLINVLLMNGVDKQ